MTNKRNPRPVNPYSPKKLKQELDGLLSVIALRDGENWLPWLDEREKKIFAVNFARILAHHRISVERAAKLLRSTIPTLLRWLNALGKRSTNTALNLARHLGVSPGSLIESVMPFSRIDQLRLGEGWRPKKGWNQRQRLDADESSPAAESKADDDPADWWKRD